jgi:hypothetical protein
LALVGVDLVTSSDVDAVAAKAAASMSKLAKQEELVQRTARKIGVESKDAAKYIALAEKEEQALAKAAAKAAAAFEKQKKSSVEASKKGQQETLKQAKGVKNLLTGNVLEASEKLPLMAVAAAGVTLAIIGATIAAGALLVKIGSLAAEAGKARQSSLAMMNVLSAGEGAKTLALVDGLAEQLGMKFQDARDSFVKFRQAGLDNSTSANLLKLKADLDSIDPSGKLAEQAIEKTLSHKKADGTLDIKKAKEEMALLAKQAGVAGDGTSAVAGRFTTLGGALKSLDNSKTKALEQIWIKIEPAVNKAAGALARFVDGFLKSAEGQRMLDGVGSAISFIAKAIEASLPFVGAVVSGFVEGFSNVKAALAPIGELLGGAFGGDKKSAVEGLKSAVTGVVTVVGLAVTVIGSLVAVGGAIMAFFSNPIAVIFALQSALKSVVVSASNVGAEMVNGLIAGVSNSAGALYAKVSELASGAWKSFKSTLGISSPSKQFQFGGDMMGVGVEKGFEESAPDSSSIASQMIPEPSALKSAASPAINAASQALSEAGLQSTGALGGLPGQDGAPGQPGPSAAPSLGGAPTTAPAAPAPAATAGGSSGPMIVIENLMVSGGTPDENGRSIRRELESMITALQLARG